MACSRALRALTAAPACGTRRVSCVHRHAGSQSQLLATGAANRWETTRQPPLRPCIAPSWVPALPRGAACSVPAPLSRQAGVRWLPLGGSWKTCGSCGSWCASWAAAAARGRSKRRRSRWAASSVARTVCLECCHNCKAFPGLASCTALVLPHFPLPGRPSSTVSSSGCWELVPLCSASSTGLEASVLADAARVLLLNLPAMHLLASLSTGVCQQAPSRRHPLADAARGDPWPHTLRCASFAGAAS